MVSGTQGAGSAADFDPYDDGLIETFDDTFAQMRRECPVVHSSTHGGFWIVTRYEEAAKVLQNAARFSNRASGSVRQDSVRLPLIPMVIDPPEQREFRRFLNPHFTAAAMAVHEPAIRRVCNTLLDSFIEDGSCDFVADFAAPLPESVFFGEVLRLPLSDAEALHHQIHRLLHSGLEESELAYAEMRRYAREVLDRRRRDGPGDDFISALLGAEIFSEPLDEDRMLRTLVLIMMAGLDTTTRTIANICHHLAEDPEMRDRLAAEPALIPTAIEEFIRYESVGGGIVRLTLEDTELAGVHIPAGERILVVIASANRDSAAFSEADRIVIDRNPNRHLAFGVGPHRCLGASLARLELSVATEEILRRLPGLALDPSIPPRYTNSTSRGLTQLGITFEPGSRGVPE